MAIMAYCRFRNILADLKDCMEHLEDVIGDEETIARDKLIQLCQQIAAEYGE